MGRTLTAAALGFAAGVAVGWLVWSRSPDSGPTIVRTSPPAAATTTSESTARETARRARRPQVDVNAPPVDSRPQFAGQPVEVAAGVREIPLDDAPTGWTSFDVELVDSDGRPVSGRIVRASPMRPPGSALDYNAIDGDGPECETDASGRGALRVASPGRYEVRVSRGLWSLWALGVVEPGTPRVRLVDPALADVEVSSAEPLADGESLKLRLFPDGAQEAAGPDGTMTSSISTTIYEDFELSATSPTWTARLPTSLRFRVIGRDGTIVDTVAVRPPAKTSVRRIAGGVLALSARIESDRLLREVGVEFVLPGGEVVGPVAVGRDGFVKTVEVAGRRGIVRWRGAEIENGEAAYNLSASGEVVATLRVRGLDAAGDAVVQLVAAPGADVPEQQIDCVINAADRLWYTNDATLVVGTDSKIPRAEGCWAVVLPLKRELAEPVDQRVAGPVRLRAGQRHVLKFGLGGFVVVAPRGTAPQGAGEIAVARADGGPLVLPDSSVQARVDVQAGTVLGPFEPGAVTLDVFVGRVRWARYEVTIRVGEHTALPIGPFGDGR